jgi:hypothetical protein
VIPHFEIDVSVDVNFAKVMRPPWDKIHQENQLIENHEYELLRGITWEIFESDFDTETEAIAYVDSKTKTHQEFEDLADDLPFDDEWGPELPPFDLGIGGTVLSLYAFKCFPVTSCRGHPGVRGARYPSIVFFAQPESAPIVAGVAAGTGVGICNMDGGTIMVYARSILDMRKFATGLQRAYPTALQIYHKLRKKFRSVRRILEETEIIDAQ